MARVSFADRSPNFVRAQNPLERSRLAVPQPRHCVSLGHRARWRRVGSASYSRVTAPLGTYGRPLSRQTERPRRATRIH